MPMEIVSIEIDEIKKFLPHREPFLFVDRVTGIEEGLRIRAERTLRPDEPYFGGHFPGNAIMPGVLITEALAQTSGLLMALTAQRQNKDTLARLFYLAKADIKWTSPARPGDILTLESNFTRTLGALMAFSVKAFTKKNSIATGSLTLAGIEGTK